MEKIINQLRTRGWAVVSHEYPLEALVCKLGTIVEDRTVEAQEQQASRPGTFSAAYGTAAFPWHSDCAHWLIPPRYLALCMNGPACGSTLTVSSARLLDAIPTSVRKDIGHAVWATKTRHGAFYASIISQRSNGVLYRYDPLCMTPQNRNAQLISEAVAQIGHDVADHRHDWHGYETLIIDNWTQFHARSSVPLGRRVRRVYINERTCS